MAMIDYGCCVKVNNKIIHQGMFMTCPSWVKEEYPYNGEMWRVKNNYFAYCGDEHFFLAFYKEHFIIVDNGIITCHFDLRFKQENLFRHNTNICVKNLDDTMRMDYSKDYTEDEFSTRMKWLRFCKWRSKSPYKYWSRRYIAEWEYNGNTYSVLYGYGIDTHDEMKRIYPHYDLTEKDMNNIDRWFNVYS